MAKNVFKDFVIFLDVQGNPNKSMRKFGHIIMLSRFIKKFFF